jgi:hypothetical protein
MSADGMLGKEILVFGRAIFTSAILATTLTACGPAHPTETPGSPLPIATSTLAKPCHARHINEADYQAWLPDTSCTPGAVNTAVSLGQLCPVAHTAQWRPPASYTSRLKATQLATKYDYVDSTGTHPMSAAGTEEDHLISLELGGSPTSVLNLWPEPHASLNEKDKVESAAHAAICAGRLTLPQAQQGIATNWIELGKRLGVKY